MAYSDGFTKKNSNKYGTILMPKRYLIIRNFLLTFIIINCCIISKLCIANPLGYSYSKFSGPVSGPETEVVTQDDDYPRVDYVAKPDYHFSYGVEDPRKGVMHNREETRDGDEVRGEYSVVDPDGTHRTVRYTADKFNGFQAEVITDGKPSSHHGISSSDDDDEDDSAASPVPTVQFQQNYHRKPPKKYNHNLHQHGYHQHQQNDHHGPSFHGRNNHVHQIHHPHHVHSQNYPPPPPPPTAAYRHTNTQMEGGEGEDDDEHNAADEEDDDDGY